MVGKLIGFTFSAVGIRFDLGHAVKRERLFSGVATKSAFCMDVWKIANPADRPRF